MMDSVVMFQGTIYEGGYGPLARVVMRDKSLHRNSKLIYAYICSFGSSTNSAERTAFPSIELQCAELGFSEDTYFKYRKPLIEKGFLQIKKQNSVSGKFSKNLYIINAVIQPITIEEKDLEKTIPENLGCGENLDKSTFEPYPKKTGTAEPYPNSPSTVKPCTEKTGAKTNSSKTKNLKKDFLSSKSSQDEIDSIDTVLLLEHENIPLIEYEKIKNKVLADETLIITNLAQYEGIMKYRCENWKPRQTAKKAKFQPKRVTRTELLPDWFKEPDEPNQKPERDPKEDLEAKKREIAEMLKRIDE